VVRHPSLSTSFGRLTTVPTTLCTSTRYQSYPRIRISSGYVRHPIKGPWFIGSFPITVDLFCYISLPIPTIIERLEAPISLLSISPAPAPVYHYQRVVGQKSYEEVEKGCNTATYLTDFDDTISFSSTLLILHHLIHSCMILSHSILPYDIRIRC
jgi:hypothetical protein